MKKTRLSDDLFKELLFKELNSGNEKAHLKTNFFQLLQTKYSLDKTRALKLHDIYYSEWATAQNKAINEQSVANTLESLQSLNISRNSLLQQLEDVKTDCFIPDDYGKINASAIIKAIEVQAKMLGLNEPEKQEIIVKSGVNSVIIE